MQNLSPTFQARKSFGRKLLLSLGLVAVMLIGLGRQTQAQEYCEISAAITDYQMCTNFFAINNVVIQDINADEEGNVDYGPGGYMDMSNIVINLFRGTSYDLTIGAGFAVWVTYPTDLSFYDQDVMVYIDWDNDGEFEDTERVMNSDHEDGGASFWHNGTVIIPSNVDLSESDTRRMRIVTDYWAMNNLSPCDEDGVSGTTYGEGRDFTLRFAPGNDAGVTALAMVNPVFIPGNQEVKATIKNYTNKTLTSCTINWSVDGVEQTPYSWEGELAMDEEEEVVIGYYNFEYKNPIESFELTAWTSSPNGATDEDQTNDELTESIFVAPALTPANYTIGTDKQFPDFTEMTGYARDYGVIGEGELHFTVSRDTYYEQIDFSGIQHDNNIFSFVSNTENRDDVIVSACGNSVVTINNPGASFIFEHMTFTSTCSTDAAAAHVFEITNHPDEVILYECDVLGVEGPDAGDMGFSTIFINGEQPELFGVEKCDIKYGSHAIYLNGRGEYRSEAAVILSNLMAYSGVGYYTWVDNPDFGWENAVIECEFSGGWDREKTNMIYPSAGVISNGSWVAKNTFSNIYGSINADDAVIDITHEVTSETPIEVYQNVMRNCFDVTGIRVQGNNAVIYENDINLENFDPKVGIQIINSGLVDDVYLEDNEVTVLEGTALYIENSMNVYAYHNYLYSMGNFFGDTPVLYAEMASGYLAVNMIVGDYANGIQLFDNYGLNLFYNSVNVFNGMSNAPLVFDNMGGFVIDPPDEEGDEEGEYGKFKNSKLDADPVVLRRNLLINSGSGPAIIDANRVSNLISDENDIYTAGTVFDLAAWQALGFDENSVSIPVYYKSMEDLHLTQFDDRITEDEPLNLEGTTIEKEFEIVDWDGEYRDVYYFGVDNLKPSIEIVDQPEPVVDCEGVADHMVTCVANVSLGGTADYQWQKDGEDLMGENSAILFFDDLDFTMSGIYRCVVSGSGGAYSVSSDEILVYVMTEPAITRQPRTMAVKEGGSAWFEVQAHIAGDYPLDYLPTAQWHKDGVDLMDDGRIAGAQSTILSISEVMGSDYNDNYAVTMTGLCGEVTSENVALTDLPGVNILTQPMDMTECEDGSATFYVEAEAVNGGTSLTYQWMKDGTDLADDARITGSASGTITISDLEMTDAGSYVCKVTVTPGNVTEESNAAALTVDAKPMIVTQPMDETVDAGREVSLIVDAQYVTDYQWMKDGNPVAGATSATLTIASATVSDAGVYKCSLSNNCGVVETNEATITVNNAGIVATVENNNTEGYALEANTPNPFNETTNIEFAVPNETYVTVKLTNEAGAEVAVLYNSNAPAGTTTVQVDSAELKLTSGVYFYTIETNGFTQTRKMILVK